MSSSPRTTSGTRTRLAGIAPADSDSAPDSTTYDTAYVESLRTINEGLQNKVSDLEQTTSSTIQVSALARGTQVIKKENEDLVQRMEAMEIHTEKVKSENKELRAELKDVKDNNSNLVQELSMVKAENQSLTTVLQKHAGTLPPGSSKFFFAPQFNFTTGSAMNVSLDGASPFSHPGATSSTPIASSSSHHAAVDHVMEDAIELSKYRGRCKSELQGKLCTVETCPWLHQTQIVVCSNEAIAALPKDRSEPRARARGEA